MRTILLLAFMILTCAGCGPKQTEWTPEMIAAVQEARGSLTNFTAALDSEKSNRLFFQVCFPVPSRTGAGGGFVWANVWKYDGTEFIGAVVASDPGLSVTNNEQVVIPATNVMDWMYLSKTGIVGRFIDHARH